jgi:hypothetical protein
LLCSGLYVPDGDASSGTGAFHPREVHTKLLGLAPGGLRGCHTSRALLLFALGALPGLVGDPSCDLSCPLGRLVCSSSGQLAYPLGRPASLALQGSLEVGADVLQLPLECLIHCVPYIKPLQDVIECRASVP